MTTPDTADRPDTLYVGIQRSVLAVDSATGAIRWSRELPNSGLSLGFVTVHLHGDRIFASTAGQLTCLDAATGAVVWHKVLEGYGIGFVTLATGPALGGGNASATDTTAAAASYTAAAATAAAAGGVAAAL